jgi:hypothetical protein
MLEDHETNGNGDASVRGLGVRGVSAVVREIIDLAPQEEAPEGPGLSGSMEGSQSA